MFYELTVTIFTMHVPSCHFVKSKIFYYFHFWLSNGWVYECRTKLLFVQHGCSTSSPRETITSALVDFARFTMKGHLHGWKVQKICADLTFVVWLNIVAIKYNIKLQIFLCQFLLCLQIMCELIFNPKWLVNEINQQLFTYYLLYMLM